MNQPPEPVPADAYDRAAAMRARHPPLWQELVIDLFFRPRSFFSDQVTLWKTRYVVVVCWVCGIADAIDRVEQELLEADFKGGEIDVFTQQLATWPNYWMFVLPIGALGGFFLWWVGGWWYRVRLGWAGAKDADPRLARLVYIYATFVYAAPMVLFTVFETARYTDVLDAHNTEELWGLGLLVFPFWSLVTSYCGIRTMFQVNTWPARVWFLILPGLLYLLAFGAIAVLYAVFQPDVAG